MNKGNFSWGTKKTVKGYEYKVIEIIALDTPNESGSYADIKTLKTGTMPTRARAKSTAQKFVRYYKRTA